MFSKYKAAIMGVAILVGCAGAQALLTATGPKSEGAPVSTGSAASESPAAEPWGGGLFRGQGEPENQGSPVPEASLTRTGLELFGYLLLILAIIGACAYGAKRLFPGSRRLFNSGAVELLSRTYLSPKQSVCLVRTGSRVLVLGCTPSQVSTLSEITDPEEIAAMQETAHKKLNRSSKTLFESIFKKKNLGFEESDIAFVAEDNSGAGRLRTVTSELEHLKATLSEGANQKA